MTVRAASLVALCLAVGGGSLRAQAPDSLNAEAARALFLLRDTTESVRSMVGRFRRDLEFAGAATLVNRARRLNEACAHMREALVREQRVFHAARLDTPTARDAARGLIDEIGRLDEALHSHCIQGLAAQGPGARADSLRAWGPYHSSRLEGRLRAYDGAAARFGLSIGVRLSKEGPGIVP